ncbi:hypothetical protein [Thiomicrorhabdus sp. Milos-T2]|uniref:hypothetical protein n=1 Tax=Thiomicrorhabdus sp. Milos-T2 TaxID=90814 RepID=UPI000493F559|nr:hypothetical protein [Thiomicrorhabdus sp. Milos-T2]
MVNLTEKSLNPCANPKTNSSIKHRFIEGVIVFVSLATLLFFLYVIDLTLFENWVLLLVFLFIAYLSFISIKQNALFIRRAILNHSLNEGSSVKSTLWSSRLVSIKAMFLSIGASFIILGLSHELTEDMGWFLLLDLFLLVFINSYIRHKYQAHFVKQNQILSMTNLTFWINLLIFSALYSWLQFNAAQIDYRGQSFDDFFGQFTLIASQSVSPFAGYPLAAYSLINEFPLFLIQNSLPKFGLSSDVKALAWLVFFLIQALQFYVFFKAFTGLMLVIQAQNNKGWTILGEDGLRKGFWGTIVLFSIITLLIMFVGVNKNNQADELANVATHTLELCSEQDTLNEQRDVEAKGLQFLNQQQANLESSLAQTINTEIETGFKSVEGGIDRFLDWNYSVKGGYQKLFYWASGDLDSMVTEKIGESFGNTLSLNLETSHLNITNKYQSKMNLVLEKQTQLLKQELQKSECFNNELKTTLTDEITQLNYAGSGAGLTAVGGSLLLIKSKIVLKLVSKMGTKISAKVFAKLGTKATTASAAAVAGAACGPFALLCGAAIGTAAWVGTDLGVESADEFMNRDQEKLELMALMESTKKELKQKLISYFSAQMAKDFNNLKGRQEKLFIPSRDGI